MKSFLQTPKLKQTKKQICVSKEKCFYSESGGTAVGIIKHWNKGKNPTLSHRTKERMDKISLGWSGVRKTIFKRAEDNQNVIFEEENLTCLSLKSLGKKFSLAWKMENIKEFIKGGAMGIVLDVDFSKEFLKITEKRALKWSSI